MRQVELLLEGGEIISSNGRFQGSIGIENGKIAFISSGWTPSAKETINLQGKIISPGFIDTHVHFREPGLTYKEDYTTGSQAAAAGGVTCVCEMTNTKPPVTTAERFKEKLEVVRKKSVVDFGIFGGGSKIEEIPGILDAGAIGIKLFMTADPKTGYPHDPELFTGDDGVLFDTLKSVANEGSFCSIHPGNQQIFEHESKKRWTAGTTSPHDFLEAYFGEDFVSDCTAVAKLVVLGGSAKARVHILHQRSERAIKIIQALKRTSDQITIEINPKYLLLSDRDMDRLGPLSTPYGLTEEEHQVLWKCVNEGLIDVFGSDHAPHTAEEMKPGWSDAWSIPFGNPQLDQVVSALLTKVNEGFISLETLVRLYSEGPAKLLGIYPQKGTIQVGSDADFTIIDLETTRTLSNEGLYTKVGWSPYEGWEVRGLPVMTIVRGKVVMLNGKVIGQPGWGQFLPGVRR